MTKQRKLWQTKQMEFPTNRKARPSKKQHHPKKTKNAENWKYWIPKHATKMTTRNSRKRQFPKISKSKHRKIQSPQNPGNSKIQKIKHWTNSKNRKRGTFTSKTIYDWRNQQNLLNRIREKSKMPFLLIFEKAAKPANSKTPSPPDLNVDLPLCDAWPAKTKQHWNQGGGGRSPFLLMRM